MIMEHHDLNTEEHYSGSIVVRMCNRGNERVLISRTRCIAGIIAR